MEEIKQTSEVSEQDVVSSEQAEVHADFSDGEAASETPPKTPEATQNSENAQRRRMAEERNRQRMEREMEGARRSAREEAILEVLNRKNPYTGEEMKDSRDIEEYLAMKEISDHGGDPVGDFAKHHKEQERKNEAEAVKKQEEEKWFSEDRKNFAEKHPDVDLGQLIKDPGFVDYADGKVGRKPLSDIYKGYMELMGKSEKNARTMAAQLLANRNASPGALSTPETGANYFSPEQVRKMSPSEVKKNYNVIRESMAKWNK